MSKLYEVSVSFAYEAEDEIDAAQQFLDNVRQWTVDWYVSVKDLETLAKVTVDTETWTVDGMINEFNERHGL